MKTQPATGETYPKSDLFNKAPHGKKTRQQCDDDEGIMIDSCVARLRKYKPEEYELVIAHFIIGISLRTIAKKQKCSDGTIRKELQTAMGFIDGCLSILLT
ncbi:antiterminator Q family protein [Escherichia coli]|uniref:antiterminator Q family protein n=1 Tax=Escherichia coli TaxID=562 RepID=UPI00202212FF|nr:antiterminator Q family protein [Escherichia coli]